MKNLFVNTSHKIIHKNKVHKLVKNLSEELKFKLKSLNINFITSKEIQQINKMYLNHNYSTDIITFKYSSNEIYLDGEIFISIDDAEYNARKYKVTFLIEITRLVVHGILHLLDYNDKSTDDKKVMKSKENKLLSSNKFVLL